MTPGDPSPQQLRQEHFEDTMLEAFRDGPGQKALAALASHVGVVLPATCTDAELRYREGQRALVTLIAQGMANASRRRAAAGSSDPAPDVQPGSPAAARRRRRAVGSAGLAP